MYAFQLKGWVFDPQTQSLRDDRRVPWAKALAQPPLQEAHIRFWPAANCCSPDQIKKPGTCSCSF